MGFYFVGEIFKMLGKIFMSLIFFEIIIDKLIIIKN